ncbi:MAG: FAD-dependent oxidoreductase [Spirochaetota bacterium]
MAVGWIMENVDYFTEPEKRLPVVGSCDVVVAGGGTGGVFAAIASARQGAKTTLVESKGYTGGTAVDGGTALHSFYNLYKAFPHAPKKQLVKGIPEEFIERLYEAGGTAGHCEMDVYYDYDSVCTAIDTEIYKRVSLDMLVEAGVTLYLNTMVVDAVRDGDRLTAIIVQSRSGREVIAANAFVDATGYGDLCAFAGAGFSEPNDYAVVNSIGVGGVSVEGFRDFLEANGGLGQLAHGRRSDREGQIIRLGGHGEHFPEAFREATKEIGMSCVTTTIWDDYFMFLKFNLKLDTSPTDRDAVSAAEVELRRRMAKGIELLRAHVPGCEHAFIARSSPQITIRRARCIVCDYDITRDDVLEAHRFDDEVMLYGFMDLAPRLQVKDGGWYGVPYRALCVSGLENLYATGMMITSDHDAHMSTRNTVSCMGHGQAAGTAAALIARRGIDSRSLEYAELRGALIAGGVVLE